MYRFDTCFRNMKANNGESRNLTQTFSEPCQTSKTERFAKIFSKNALTIFTKRSILDLTDIILD